MNLYVDDNRAAVALAALLRKGGHRVVRPADANLIGASDPRHLEFAIRNQLVALTDDRRDFWDLNSLILTSGGGHPGILVVRYDNVPKHNMKPKDIVAALTKVEKAAVQLANQVVVLNHWR